MKSESDNFEPLRHKLDELEVAPPKEVWAAVEQRLSKPTTKGLFNWDIILMLLVLSVPLANYSMQGKATATVVDAEQSRNMATAEAMTTSNRENSSSRLTPSTAIFETATSANGQASNIQNTAKTAQTSTFATETSVGSQQHQQPPLAFTASASYSAETPSYGRGQQQNSESIVKVSPSGLTTLSTLWSLLPEQIFAFDSLVPDAAPMASKSPFKKHEIYVGAMASVNLPMIINQNTYGVFGDKEPAYSPTIGYGASVRLGYVYKHRYTVETGFVFLSKMGQNYADKFSGVDARRQVTLSYMHVPLLLQYRLGHSHSKKHSTPWCVGLGAQLDLLQKAAISFDGNQVGLGEIQPIADARAYFKPVGISALVNVERDIYINKFMFVGVGLRAAFSNDINSTMHPVADDYGISHNFSLGLHVSINGFLRR